MWSPGRTRVTSAPTASTMPAPSCPMTIGLGIANWRRANHQTWQPAARCAQNGIGILHGSGTCHLGTAVSQDDRVVETKGENESVVEAIREPSPGLCQPPIPNLLR